MAVSPLDSPPYTPLHPPQVSSVDLQQTVNWAKQELDSIARSLTAVPGILYTPNNAPPQRPREGMTAFADGTNWNPSDGKGLYIYLNGIWVPAVIGVGAFGSGLKIYNVLDYGPNGTDITTALRKARDAAQANGGGIIWIPAAANPWIVTSAGAETGPLGSPTSCIIPSNVFVDGGGTIDFQTTTANAILFGCAGTSSVDTTLSAAATTGAETVTVTSAAGLNVGDIIQINGNDNTNNIFYFWCTKITGIAGTTITLAQTLPINWKSGANLGNTSGWVTGGGYRNLNLIGTNALTPNPAGIFEINTIDRLYQNLTFLNFSGTDVAGTGSAFGFENFSSYKSRAFDLRSKGGGTKLQDDMAFRWASNLTVGDMHTYECAGFGVAIANASDSQIGRLSATGKTIYGRMVKVQGCVRCNFESIHVINGNSTGLAIANGTQRCNFGTVLLYGCPSSTFVGGNAIGLWFSDQHNTENLFSLVDSSAWLDYDIATGATDTGNVITEARYSLLSNLGSAIIYSDIGTAWTSYSPTVTSNVGTITTLGAVAARYKIVGKLMFLNWDVTITTAGTAAGNALRVTFPSGTTAQSNVTGYGREDVVTGKMLQAKALTGGSLAAIFFYDNTGPIANGARMWVSMVVELA